MKILAVLPMLLCAGCVVRYDHRFLRSDESCVTRLGRAELTVTAAGEGSGSRTRPPWALRFTGEGFKKGFILVKNLRATVNGRVVTHPDVRLDLSEASWAQKLTGNFIPKPEHPGDKVTVTYRVLSSDSPGREVPEKFEFHVEKESGTVVANPLLDFT